MVTPWLSAIRAKWSSKQRPEEILDVIADVESTPDWSSQYQGAEISNRMRTAGRGRVKMKLKTMGISDEQVVEYTWTDNNASWTLISPRASSRRRMRSTR